MHYSESESELQEMSILGKDTISSGDKVEDTATPSLVKVEPPPGFNGDCTTEDLATEGCTTEGCTTEDLATEGCTTEAEVLLLALLRDNLESTYSRVLGCVARYMRGLTIPLM